jgi:hypothetical protein
MREMALMNWALSSAAPALTLMKFSKPGCFQGFTITPCRSSCSEKLDEA